MAGPFADRQDAGRQLAVLVAQLKLVDPVVLGLPRGGVPVALEVAKQLHAPLDVIVVRKIGLPWYAELGVGATGEDNITVFNHEILESYKLDVAELQSDVAREQGALLARVRQIRASHPQVKLKGRCAVVVDDGVATGIDARVACRVAKARGAREVVLAVPVAPFDWRRRLQGEADRLVAVQEPLEFAAVGQAYLDFSPTSDAEMLRCLDADTS